MGKHRQIRYCVECGKPLPEGRADRMYCGQSCRSRHYYRAQLLDKETRHSTIAVLDRNHRILSELIRKKVDSIRLPELLFRGFCPDFMTSCRRKARYIECGCYDIFYNQTADRIFSITKIVV